MKLSLRQTTPSGVGKTSPSSFGLRAHELLAEDAARLTREANLTTTGARLRRNDLSLPRTGLDEQRPPFEVDGPVAKGEQLALAQPGQAREADEVAVRLDRLGSEQLDLRPVEESHLDAVAARRPDAEDRLVDVVAALLRAAQDHLERVEHQLGRARRTRRDRVDVILDLGGANRLELDRVEDLSRFSESTQLASVAGRTRWR